jgi:hypothetical protein
VESVGVHLAPPPDKLAAVAEEVEVENGGGDDGDAVKLSKMLARRSGNAVRKITVLRVVTADPGEGMARGDDPPPPPVGSEERAISNYMLLDFEGGATMLLPHRLDQHSEEEGGEGVGTREDHSSRPGWVTSLDWTPGRIRYQLDRKVLGGTKLKGLRTLELSEVQGEDVDRWRPKDGGSNMRQ